MYDGGSTPLQIALSRPAVDISLLRKLRTHLSYKKTLLKKAGCRPGNSVTHLCRRMAQAFKQNLLQTQAFLIMLKERRGFDLVSPEVVHVLSGPESISHQDHKRRLEQLSGRPPRHSQTPLQTLNPKPQTLNPKPETA